MMRLLVLTLYFVAVIVVNSKELEKGPQTFTNLDVNASAKQETSQKQQKRLATKEIIMYLTPTQIKSLQSGLAYITSQPLAKHSGSGLNQEREYLFNIRNPNDDRKELENVPTLKAITEPSLQIPLSQKNQEEPLFYPDLDRQKANDLLLGQRDKELAIPTRQWVPYNTVNPHPVTNNDYQDILLNNQNKEEWNPILEYERSHSNILSSLQPFKGLDILLSPEKRLSLNYAPIYNNHKNIQDIDLELRHRNALEKQRALSEIQAIVSQNQAIKQRLPTSFEHIPEPLPYSSVNSKALYEKNLTPLLTSPFFYSSKNLGKQQY